MARVRRPMTSGHKGPNRSALADGSAFEDGSHVDWNASMEAWERLVVWRLRDSAREIVAEAERVVFDLRRGALDVVQIPRWQSLAEMAQDIEDALLVLREPPTADELRHMPGVRNWRECRSNGPRSLPPVEYPSRWDRLPAETRAMAFSKWQSKRRSGFRP